MGSINMNPFESWFRKPQNQPRPINPQFAALNLSNLFSKKPDPKPDPEPSEDDDDQQPGRYTQMGEQFFWECENRPDYRHAPEVEKILNEDPVWENKENPTEEEVRENERFWKEFRSSPVVKFMAEAQVVADKLNEMELKKNDRPINHNDRNLWKDVPHVIGLDGRPMPRKRIRSRVEKYEVFWDFVKQFIFGLWGFRQRPYPPGKPIDVAQAFGYKNLEKRNYDFIMRSGGWYYKDRLGRTRGPLELITLKTAYGAGIIDRNTFIWGEDMDEWAPISMIYGMERAIATWEVRLGAAATAFIHKLQKGIPPWVPLKGREHKTYKQLQKEAMESKRRDLAVLEANDGVWPGVRTPSHALFLWASGSELTTILEQDHMPNKYIPKDLRRQLSSVIPGLRPWEVLSVEQAMDQITYGGEWYREPLGSYTTGPPYLKKWNPQVENLYKCFVELQADVVEYLQTALPGFDKVMQKYEAGAFAGKAKRKSKRDEKNAQQ